MPTTTNSSLPLKQYKRWLRLELSKAGLDHGYLVAQTILLERVINHEQTRLLRHSCPPPFYRLTNGEGHAGRSWLYAAEAALWLNYKGYDTADWFTAICNWPPIKKRLLLQQQVSMHLFSPSTRLGTEQLKDMEKFYLKWVRDNAKH